MLAVPLRRVRIDLLARELPRKRMDLPLLGRELEVHAQDYMQRMRGPSSDEG